MNSIKKIIVLLTTVVTIQACGGSASKPTTDASTSSTTTTSVSNTDPKILPEMEAFMEQLDGKSQSVVTALDTYGVADLDRKYMDMFNLEKAKVVSADKDCYTMEAGAGVTVRIYLICWEAGKIKSIEEKGMK